MISNLLLLWLLSACHQKQATVQPVLGNITESVYASGIIKGENQYQVYANVNGLVDQVLVSEGDLVKKGTPVIKLINNVATLNRENAGISAHYAAVASHTERLDELKNAIDIAEMRMENEEKLFARQKSLWAQKIGTRNEFELRELSYKNALNAYETAKLQYTETLKQLHFQEQQSRKNLQIVTASANDYIIRSACEGQIYNVLKEVGEMVTPQTAVATIGDQQRFLIELQIDEYDIAKIKVGQQVLINMDSYKGKVFEAKVSKVIPFMNERSKSFTVEADFVRKPPTLYPNLTCEANIVIAQKTKALTIPRECLLKGGFVLLENNIRQKVNTGLMDFEKVEILAGLQGSEHLIKPNP